jgi:hypothetical protein
VVAHGEAPRTADAAEARAVGGVRAHGGDPAKELW